MSWQSAEAKRYDEAYKMGEYVPTFGPWFMGFLLKRFDFSKVKTFLDVGCGTGGAVEIARHIGLKGFGMDFAQHAAREWEKHHVKEYCAVASADGIPFPSDYFDFVLCTEMLEHIPEQGVPAVLKEIYRVGRGDFVFTIALGHANIKMPQDGSEPHVCVKPVWWWEQQLVGHGYTTVAELLSKENGNMVVWSSKLKYENQHRRNESLQ